MSKPPEEPVEPDNFDHELADAISSHQTDETIIENARLVALYFTALVDGDIPHEYATELTCHWVAMMQAES